MSRTKLASPNLALWERVRLKACKTQDLLASKSSGGPNMRASAWAFAEVDAL